MHYGKGIRLNSLARERLKAFWSSINVNINDHRLAIIGSDCPQNFSFLHNKNTCCFVSTSKRALKEAKKLGFYISISLNQFYNVIVLELTKSTHHNFALVASAEQYINSGGSLIINGENNLGVKSFFKKVAEYWQYEKILVKKRGRVALFLKKKNC